MVPVAPQLVGTFVLAMFCGVDVTPVAAVVVLPAYQRVLSDWAGEKPLSLLGSLCSGW